MDEDKIKLKLNGLKVLVTFNLLKEINIDKTMISCSDIESKDGRISISFCRSELNYGMDISIIMSEMDLEYHEDNYDNIYNHLSCHNNSDYIPLVSYMTEDDVDLDYNDYLKFKSLEIIWEN